MSFGGSSGHERWSDGEGRQGEEAGQSSRAPAPGKTTLTSQLPPVEALIQRRGTGAPVGGGADQVHAAAAHGIRGGGGGLPHLDTIQRAFGKHDVGQIQAHVGGEAAEGAQAMGAEAFATGQHVGFAAQPDLHTAAHEAAHVVQQRGGVSLKGGVGEQGDGHERHADAVADAVVGGGSAEALLDQYGGGSSAQGVQMRGNKAVETYQNNVLQNPFTEDHIFKGEVDNGDPKGLHAYSNGTAGESVEVLATLGNTNRVHVIIWTKGAARGARKAKWSSMFPQGMHKGIAAWYINNGPGDVDGTGNGGRVGTGWATLSVRHAGNTAYPEGGPSWQGVCEYDNRSRKWTFAHSSGTYTITNP
jgi:hypothetical protein